MPKSKIKEIQVPGGSNISAIEVNFETIREVWNEYKLEDGTVVRVKNAMLKMFLQVDENGTPTYNENGDLNVVILGHQLVVASEKKD